MTARLRRSVLLRPCPSQLPTIPNSHQQPPLPSKGSDKFPTAIPDSTSSNLGPGLRLPAHEIHERLFGIPVSSTSRSIQG